MAARQQRGRNTLAEWDDADLRASPRPLLHAGSVPTLIEKLAFFSTEAAAVTLLFGLVAFGQIVWRRIDGHAQLAASLAKERSQVA